MLDDIRRFRGTQFQDFCNRLLSLDDPTFQSVDGSGGDLGNDGFCVRGDTLYQAYAPERRVLAKVRTKVDASVEKATELRGSAFPDLRRLVFLTPFDLTHHMHEHLRRACAQASLVAESWGEARLHSLVGSHPEVRSLFPEYLLADVIGLVTGAVAGQTAVVDAVEDERALARGAMESLGWPRTLPGGATLARPELDRLAADLASDGRRSFALLGAPGSGKSALLASLGQHLVAKGVKVAALRCDRIPTSVHGREDLAKHLGLTDALDRVLAGMAGTAPTVLLIDQLDALCDIVDLQSERLNAVLDLLDRARDVEDLRVVVASRDFDFNHDSRLRRLGAEPVRLELPSWPDVAAVLTASGISPTQFPTSMQEALRIPQQLKVFLSLSEGRDTLQSYQGMLEQFWQERVARDPAKVLLTNLIAEAMADQEVLAVAASIADGRLDALEQLVHDGVLRLDETFRLVSFGHQTLFEFARARTFGRDRDLARYVKDRQDGVFVRPTLWSALAYLRATAPATYMESLSALWSDDALRLHIRHLLVEFVGQVSEPSGDETELLLGAVRDRALCSTALAATAGRVDWFSRLYSSGVFVRETAARAPQAVAAVLASAVQFDPERVALALRAIAAEPVAAHIILCVLQSAQSWSQAHQDLARDLARRTSGDPRVALSLASKAARRVPDLAVELFTLRLNAVLSEAPPTEPSEHWGRSDKGADAVFDLAEHFYELGELAGAVPASTRDALFPIWVRLNERLAIGRDAQKEYRPEGALECVADAHHPRALGAAVRRAIEESAARDPAGFVDFARRFEDNDLNGVHAMLSFGFAALPAVHQRATLEYLLRDPRRLRIRGFGDPDTRTRALLRASSPSLTSTDLPALEELIWNSEPYDEKDVQTPVTLRREGMRANRRHRLRLLLSLPQALLSARARRTVSEDSLVFHRAEEPDTEVSIRHVGSPMSSAQMEKASDADIVHLFDALAEVSDDDPWAFRRGDSGQASIELARLAKQAPERALAIVAVLRPDDHQWPMASVLSALSEAGVDGFDRLLLDADARGFTSEEFRYQMSYAIAGRARAGTVVPASVVALLERWLDEAPPARVGPSQESAGAKANPILFGFMGGGVLPRGGYPMLHALLCVLHQETPPAIGRWLESLERRLASAETASAWSALCYELPRLGWLADRDRVRRFFAQLFEKHPTLLESARGAYVLARIVSIVDESLIQELVARQTRSQSRMAQQAAGELLLVFALRNPGCWADAELERLSREEGRSSLLIGAGFAAAHTWGDPGTRRAAARWLAARFVVAQDAELEALFSAYGPRQELWGDEMAVDVLGAISRNPLALAAFPDEGLDQFELLVPHAGELVVHFVNAMLDAMASLGLDAAARFQWSGSAFVDITLLLQRKIGTRVAGMALFERLLSLGLSSVRDVLFEIDARPRFDPPPPRLPRRPRIHS